MFCYIIPQSGTLHSLDPTTITKPQKKRKHEKKIHLKKEPFFLWLYNIPNVLKNFLCPHFLGHEKLPKKHKNWCITRTQHFSENWRDNFKTG